jgi:hypothetical protein
MANELNIALSTGLTVTAQRYQAGAAVGSAISCPETGSTGFYSGNMTGTAGTYQLAFLAAGANVGSGSIVWSGTAEVPASTFNPASDTVATVTTLTNAPSVPSASAIASQVRTELATELARVDVATSTRLATSGYTAPSTAPTVTAIRQEMDSNSTKLANLDATVSSRLAPGGTLAVVTTLTNAPSVPSASAIASQVRTELATELARVDVATSTRLAGSAYSAPANSDITAIKAKTDNLPALPAATGDIPSANISAIKAKTDLLNTDRLAQVSTVSTTGAQLAAALS